jgi:SagB-type dehydrogenase family enzyme
MGYAHDYATAVMHRGRVPMEPADHVPNWKDGPRKGKHYPGVAGVPLPTGTYPADASVERGLTAPGAPAGGGFDLDALSGMLLDSYGLTGRRIAVQANSDMGALPFYPLANWSRGTASGGGLYPVSVYWVSGPSGPLDPGVHYYHTGRHAMQRLMTGDVTGEVRAALGEDAPEGAAATDQYLVLGVKYWQNAFKYNSFSFHVVSMDVGACVATWRLWAQARGLRIEPALWFDEARLTRLLGVDGEEEGVFAVVPLRWAGAEEPPAPAAALPESARPVRHRDVEKSRTVQSFEAVRRMHAVTSAEAGRRPDDAARARAAAAPAAGPGGPFLPLPAARTLETDVRGALRARRSSFGRFDPGRPLSADRLAACLSSAAAGARLGGDTAGPDLTRLYVFVNHVEGVAPGGYAYDPTGGEDGGPGLRPVTEGAPGAFLQKNYFLSNYNLEHAGAVLVVAARTHAVLDAVGDRGYRLVNAAVGASAQALYTACAAMDVGCGVALGFDNISYTEELGLDDRGEAPLLIMMVGNERQDAAAFRYEIV